MEQKKLFSRCMATLSDLIITLLPILAWDLIIFIILAGFLPSTVMTFLDKVIIYILIVSFCVTNPFITLVYGKTLGQMIYDIRILNNQNKNATNMQRVLRECLSGIIIISGFYFFNGLPIIAYTLINMIVIIVDKKDRGIVDFICQTHPINIIFGEEDVKVVETKKKEVEQKKEEVFVAPSKSEYFYHYDLHVHSKHSTRGNDTVEEIFQKAKSLGIEVLSITDEYSAKANIEAEVLSKPYGIQYISGIQMSCIYKGYELQVLGYGIDYKNHLFIQLENEHLRLQRAASKERIEKFKEVTGVDLNFSKLVNQTNSGIVTAESIVQEALTNPLYEDFDVLKEYRNIENSYQRLYMDYFAPKKPCYVQVELPELEIAVECIKTAGGLVVLANPKKACGDDLELLKDILSQGIDGLEVFSSYHSEEDMNQYLSVAREMNCFVSCGSDYYGNNNLMIEIGDSKATAKYEKLIRVLIDYCLKKIEK